MLEKIKNLIQKYDDLVLDCDESMSDTLNARLESNYKGQRYVAMTVARDLNLLEDEVTEPPMAKDITWEQIESLLEDKISIGFDRHNNLQMGSAERNQIKQHLRNMHTDLINLISTL